MGILVLLRHGQSQWNLENRFTGWTDIDLSDRGIEEAKSAGHILKQKSYHFDRAFCSTLIRAKHTMDIVLELLDETDIPIQYDSALNERHYGLLQGKNKAETAAEVGSEQVRIWRRSYDVRPPKGESLKDTIDRALPYFKKSILPRVHAGETVLVSAHGNSLRGLVMSLENIPKHEITHLEIPTGIPLAYEIDSESNTSKIGYLKPVHST